MMPIVINGRFLTQGMTGVQRFAREITAAADRLATRVCCLRCGRRRLCGCAAGAEQVLGGVHLPANGLLRGLCVAA
jgi:hypothetical protein